MASRLCRLKEDIIDKLNNRFPGANINSAVAILLNETPNLNKELEKRISKLERKAIANWGE